MSRFPSFRTVLATALLMLAPTALAAETPPADTTQPTDDLAGIQADDVITVTGTRLDEDPTTRVLVITAQEIAERGLATTEEIIRSIPQNFATINSFNNTTPTGTLDTRLGALGLGVATVNLRGLGSRNTLVLVNGRRVAGVAGADEFFANIRNIPAASIERVEILLDGAGAVYGSDAVGGVVNIILKQDYTGVNLTGHYEDSATGGDHNRVGANLGYSWSGGNVTATLSREERDPVNNHKTGYTTRDYRSRFGGKEDYNFVGTIRPRSALVSVSRWGPFRILPPGNDGKNAQPGDFVATTPADYRDLVKRDASGATEDQSGTLAVNHTFRDKLTLRGEVIWQESTTESQATQIVLNTLRVPASNAFNRFGQDVFVRYDAQAEIDAGLLSPGRSTSVREHRRYLIGLDYAWRDTMGLVFDHVSAVSDGFRRQYRFAPRSIVATEVRNERLAALLASSDPNEAANFFGDGSGQNPTIAEFYLPFSQDTDRSYTRMTTSYFRGDVFDAPGGRAEVVVGGEARQEWLRDLDFSQEVERGIGVAKPTRDLTAAFFEVRVPLFGPGNERRGVKSLTVAAKARWDKYETEGAVGEEPNDPNDPSAGTRGLIVKATFANVAPYLGIAYQPIDNLTVRISRASGFVAPRFRNLFSRQRIDQPFFTFDPLLGRFVQAHVRFGSNPDLNPELSTTFTAGVEWAPTWVEDLHIELYYSDVDIRDRIASNFELGQLLPAEIYGNIPQFFERAEDGSLITAISTSVNISRRVSKALDFSVAKTFRHATGDFLVGLHYNRILNQYDQAFRGTEKVNSVGRSVGIDRYKAALNLNWTRGATTVSAFVSHTPSYVNNEHARQTVRDIPNMRVSSWTTLDMSVGYRFDNGVTLRAGGRDLLGRDFPFMLTGQGRPWDVKRVNLRGRVLFLDVSYDFGIGK